MAVDVLMPALSPTMEKGNLAKWLKKEGDKVRSGDVLAEIETDKATMEVEAIDEGVLAKILVPAGTSDVLVNTLIAVIAEEGEELNVKAAPKATSAPIQAPQNVAQMQTQVAQSAPVIALAAKTGERIFATPLARRMAQQQGLDLAKVRGSGPHGRIVVADLGGAGAATGKTLAPTVSASAPVAAPLATSASSETVKAMYEAGTYEEVSLDNMRKTIARRLVESKQTVPHFYLSVDCQLDNLLAARVDINASAPKGTDGKPSYKLSVNDFIIKAMAVALQRVPDANVVWAEDRVLKFKHSDVGVAVSVEGGLFTPVIKNAESKGLAAISAEMKDLATRARTKKLKPHEYQGGSTAISNLGMYGIQNFSAVINPPHATILAVGAGEERVVVRKGQMVVANMMSVTLSTDHRAVDGALGAQLLAAFKDLIENPVKLVV